MAKFIIRATEKGMAVSTPALIEGLPYDAILDDGSKLFRVQLKSRKPYCPSNKRQQNLVQVRLGGGRSKRKFYSGSEVDSIVVYMPETDKFAWFDIGLVEGRASLLIYLYRKKRVSRNSSCSFLLDDYLW